MASAPSPFSFATNSCPSFSRRPDTTTRALSCAKMIAAARPIPVSAPVIKTTGEFMAPPPLISRLCTSDMTVRAAAQSGQLMITPIDVAVVLLIGTLLSSQRCFRGMGAGMELRHLRYFVAVAEAGGLTAAAQRKLHTSPPSLSRQIPDL